jgi:hypothetical protein
MKTVECAQKKWLCESVIKLMNGLEEKYEWLNSIVIIAIKKWSFRLLSEVFHSKFQWIIIALKSA